MIRLSKSKINCFDSCNYHYKLSYVDKVKIDSVPEQLQKGIEVHALFEAYNKLPHTKLIDAEVEIKTHQNYIKYQKILNNFFEFNKKISGDKINIDKPLHSEVRIEDDEIGIVGVIDAVHRDRNKLLILDYKTGKTHPMEQYRFELSLYAYLYMKKFGKKVTHIGIFFCEHNKLMIEEINYTEIEKALEKVKKIRSEIEECEITSKWEKNRSPLCGWCDMQQNGFCLGW